MSRSLGSALPTELAVLLDGSDLRRREGLTFLLVTVAEGAWPHVALLSVGEVVATSERELRFALWTDTTTTRNLTAAGPATLMLVHGRATYHVRLSARREPDLALAHARRAFFVASVEEVLEDAVSYAELTSGVRFRLTDPEETVPMWEETVAAMRAAAVTG
ncbi:MAG TPA: hypothetical protein DCK98_05170 [Chloroflexi bacterium]|jgi:hypothetical protein|nr:hypothetical protein [Chloroflexota bacterium]HAL25260.1 hypothetical protein [Chloroflexota bacterium]